MNGTLLSGDGLRKRLHEDRWRLRRTQVLCFQVRTGPYAVTTHCVEEFTWQLDAYPKCDSVKHNIDSSGLSKTWESS